MPDIPAPIPEPSPSEPKPVVAMQIVLLSDGNVTVAGPLADFRLVAKMIGMALNAAAQFKDKEDGARLVQAAPDALRLLNGRA